MWTQKVVHNDRDPKLFSHHQVQVVALRSRKSGEGCHHRLLLNTAPIVKVVDSNGGFMPHHRRLFLVFILLLVNWLDDDEWEKNAQQRAASTDRNRFHVSFRLWAPLCSFSRQFLFRCVRVPYRHWPTMNNNNNNGHDRADPNESCPIFRAIGIALSTVWL